jgi:hypothetical protein
VKNRRVLYGLAGATIMFCIFAGAWIATGGDFVRKYPVNVGSFDPIRYFRIDPATLLASLDKNPADVFLPEPDMSMQKVYDKPISWSQANYATITEKLAAYVWQDALTDWMLFRMDFGTSCQDVPVGFDTADYIYFRTTLIGGRWQYVARAISITPQYGDAATGDNTNFPRPILGWKYIRPDSVRVTAETALQKAELEGGEAARRSMQNQCQIHVIMYPNLYGHSNWKIVYGGNSNAKGFQTIIPASP